MTQAAQESEIHRPKKRRFLPGFKTTPSGRTRASVIKSYLKEGADLRLSTAALASQIESAADAITRSFRNGCKMMVFGNGGSAADAQHIAAELSGRFQKERNPLPALALTVNPSSVTAIANDYSFDEIFARQIRALAKPGDVALGISTSGQSRNVLKGLETAQELGVHSIGMCGLKGGMAKHSDILLAVPGQTTSLLQEVHIAIGHLLCLLVEDELFG